MLRYFVAKKRMAGEHGVLVGGLVFEDIVHVVHEELGRLKGRGSLSEVQGSILLTKLVELGPDGKLVSTLVGENTLHFCIKLFNYYSISLLL